jgi:hypothetical protein
MTWRRWQPTSPVGLELPCVTRGEKLRSPVEGRSRRSDTVWQRRSTELSAAGKTRYGGFSNRYFRNHHLLRSGDSIHVFDQTLP